MSQDVSVPIKKLHLKSVMDLLTSAVLIGAALTVIYKNVLSAPKSSAAEIEVPSAPLTVEPTAVLGSKDAQVVMIVYSDFQCPYCSRFAREVLPEIRKRYISTGNVALAFRHLPLPIHSQAVQAAAVAECAGRQGKFWEMHDRLFAEKALNEEILRTLPQSAAVDQRLLTLCLGDPAVGQRVANSVAEANALGVRGTPAFFVGKRLPDGRVRIGHTISGSQPAETFFRILDAALRGDDDTSWRSWLGRLAS